VENIHTPKVATKQPSLIWFPIAICLLIVIAYLVFGNSLKVISFGILPRDVTGARGILLSPFIHGEWNHLLSNLLPMLVLGLILFGTYRDIAFRVFFLIYALTGLWVWMFARESYHIGASGVVYGLWSFVLISGFLRRRNDLVMLSFLVAFLYGSMFWGLFPIFPDVSFEAHICGMLAGVMCAIYYLPFGPKERKYFEDEEDEPDDPEAPWNQPAEDKEAPPVV
jgi:membrane associated rhomboid family serine protease